ncbi:MAG: hypothetical protein A2174_02905 [Candidatus Portnoybacteria bacterium RBG_13_41_18]|uniref:Uncharacterized protein n=1 Tax=Candidatus Portnoybacteria bacterium RBG_13_41_18 TaxID=1801991 RepID=A0A1G2FAI3_9BACT|nr:MAG: hypothetical protein A2174_02905 [Candidatus Portnoybacteria bacterium RBG_13_41_18]
MNKISTIWDFFKKNLAGSNVLLIIGIIIGLTSGILYERKNLSGSILDINFNRETVKKRY